MSSNNNNLNPIPKEDQYTSVPLIQCPHKMPSLSHPKQVFVNHGSEWAPFKNCSSCSASSSFPIEELWFCLTCQVSFCSENKSHAEQHFREKKSEGHLGLDLDSLLVWCPQCSGYIEIEDSTMNLWRKEIFLIKFPDKNDEVSKFQLYGNPKKVGLLSPEKPAEQPTPEKKPEVEMYEVDSDEESSTKKPNAEDESDSDSSSSEGFTDIPPHLLSKLYGLSLEENQPKIGKPLYDLDDLSLASVAKAINAGKVKNIIVMAGAGLSVAAGIPDFRSPKTGLYANLQKYGLPHPTAVFELDYFRKRPEPFFTLAKELYPGVYKPTKAHFFIKMLEEKGLLLRCFTQNIDTLEREAGISSDRMVEAHGSFAEAHCIDCRAPEDVKVLKEKIFSGKIPPRCVKCNGLVKPDIVFFGENLPVRFFQLMEQDFPLCDLLIVMGTSLQVHPFASLVHRVGQDVPRILINNEKVGAADPNSFIFSKGFLFDRKENFRDIAAIGDLQEQTMDFIKHLGWEKEFQKFDGKTSN